MIDYSNNSIRYKTCYTNSETNILELDIKRNKLIYFLIHFSYHQIYDLLYNKKTFILKIFSLIL